MAIPSFIFDAQTTTPEELAQRRALAQALLNRGQTGIANNIGEGLAQFGQALAGRMQMGSVNRAEKSARDKAYGLLGPLFSGGAPSSAPAPMAGNAGMAKSSGSPDIATGIVATANALGIDPVDLGTAISYETAGTFDPTKAGPRTQWGQHKGLIQFGEPQAKQYGVDWNDPVGTQLGADGAVAKYLKAAGVKPGMGMMDVYSAINAGSVGRNNASDANNGGAPGTVADKVNGQMTGHRAKAQALLASVLNGGAIPQVPAQTSAMPAPAPQGTAMTGFPPQAAPMAPQIAQQPPQAPQIVPTAGPAPVQQQMAAPQAPMSAYQRMVMTSLGKDGGIDDPRNRAIAQQAGIRSPFAPQSMPQQPMTNASPMAPQAPQMPVQGGGRLDQLRSILMSPSAAFLDDTTKQILVNEYKMELERSQPPDPMKQIELEKSQIELNQLKNPRPKPGYTLLTPQQKKAMGIPEDAQVQVSPDGKIEPITGLTPKDTAKPAAIQEYEYAKQQGFPGTFQDWEASKKGNMEIRDPVTGNVIFSTGNVKPMTEAQSKDTVYATRAKGALEQFEPNAMAMTEFGSTMGGKIPGVGNYLKSKEYQQAEQSGREFLAAILRKDSGGAITPAEVDEYGGTYLPRPGDGPDVLSQKKQSRERAVKALEAGMTPQAILAQEKALAASGSEAAPAPAQPPVQMPLAPTTAKNPDDPKPGEIVDGFKFKGGDPAKEENWEMVQ